MSYRTVTIAAESLALKLKRDWESATVRPRGSMIDLLAEGYIWLPDANGGEIVDLVREVGLLGSCFLYSVGRWVGSSQEPALTVDGSEVDVRIELQNLADAFSEFRVRAALEGARLLAFESTVEDVLLDMLDGSGVPGRYTEALSDLLRLLSIGSVPRSSGLFRRASQQEIALLDEVIRVGGAVRMRIEELIAEAERELVRRYGESYLRRLAQSGRVGRLELNDTELVPLDQVIGKICEDGDPVATAMVALARKEIARWSSLTLSEAYFTARNTVRVKRLEDDSVRELRLGRAAALIQREMEQRGAEVKAVQAVLPVLGELPVGLEPLKVELYLGEACEEAYCRATADGIRSCMANEDGAVAMGMSARELDRAVGVVLFRKAVSGVVIARCRVYVVACTGCGCAMTFADRLYVGDTRYSTVVDELRHSLVDVWYPSDNCPHCGKPLAKLARLHGGKQPYEDTFDQRVVVDGGLLVLSAYADTFAKSAYSPEQMVAAISTLCLEEQLRLRKPDLEVIRPRVSAEGVADS